ncbi:lysozyme [Bradyrhizobium sp. PMVTL-01]|uniref:lysozyme n=1 Tax=Bradyrhizobium sp. PMVTL-01 TaxID=3434999 RepID=UPI003F6FE3F9
MAHPLEYTPFPTQNPSVGGTGAHERIQTSPDMFGGGIAHGVEQLGHGIEAASDAGFQALTTQEQLDSQTHAAELHSWQSEQTSKAQAEFLTLKGRAAIDALPEFDKKIRDIHDQAKSQAGNPYTTRLVDDQGRRLVDVTSSGAARHAATERKTWETKTAADSAQSYGSRAVLLATQSQAPQLDGDLTVQNALGNSDNEVRNLFHGQGYDDPAIEAEVQKNRGRNVKQIVEQIASDASSDSASPQSVKRAFDFYKSQEDKIDAASRVAIQNYLKGPLNQIAGTRIADEAMGRPPGGAARPEVVADIPENFIAAIKNTEGYRAKAYWDVKQHAVGYGTRANSPDEVITPEEANARFNREIGKAAKIVDTVNPNLDAGTRAALTSLTFNAGDQWTRSGLGDAVRAGDMAKAKEIFLQYNKADGETNEGLAKRRAREAAWFGRGDISPTEATIPHANKGDVMLKILDNPDLQNRPQVQAAALARVNKIYQAWDLQSAQEKATFGVTVKNSTAEALATGEVKNPLSREQFITNYGVQEGEDAWQEYQKSVQFGADLHTTAGLSLADLAALRQKHQPQPGDHFIDQQKRLAMLDRAIAANEKAKADDPANFLITRTDAGRNMYQQFQTQMADKAATAEMRTAYASMFAEKMRAEQLRLGVPADKVQIVPQAYIDQLAARLNNPALNGGSLAVSQGIEAEAKLWGTQHWPEVYRQLADKVQPVVRVIGSGIKPDAAQVLADLAPFSLPQILKDQDTEKNAAIKKDVLDAFKPLAGSMGGQDGAISVFNDFREQAEKLAARYVIGGMTSRDAAEKAFEDMIGFKYTFQEGYRVPKDPNIDPKQVMAGANAVKLEMGTPRAPSPDLPAPGRIEKGNIDLDRRPVVKNPDGTISTVRSLGANIDGKETLIPTVSDDGRIMSDEEAIETFKRTGKHLGKFDTPDNSSSYAQALHEQQAQRYGQRRFDVAPARDTLGGLSPEYLSRETAAAYARDGKWVTSPDEKGLMLTYNDRAVRMADGGPLIVSWQELQDIAKRTYAVADPRFSGAQP